MKAGVELGMNSVDDTDLPVCCIWSLPAVISVRLRISSSGSFWLNHIVNTCWQMLSRPPWTRWVSRCSQCVGMLSVNIIMIFYWC